MLLPHTDVERRHPINHGTLNSDIPAGELFFPKLAPGLGVLAAFGAYGVAFFIRPLGGLLLGWVGDRHGRKPALMISLIVMGVSTVALAFLPTYGQIGIWAPVLLVLLRLGQGFGAGAEAAGALALVTEYAPLRRRGFYTGILQSTALVGVLLSSLSFLAVSALPPEAMQGWGWRIPFLSAALLFVVAVYLRSRLEESPEYRTAVAGSARRHHPLALLFGRMRKQLALAFVLISAWNVLAAVMASFIASYLRNTVHMSATASFTVLSIGTLTGVIATVVFGGLSDRHGFRRIWTVSLVATIPGVFLLFLGMQTGQFWIATISVVLAYAIIYGAGAGAFPGVLSNLFPTEVRYSGIAAVRELSAALIAGTAPFIATALVLAAGGAPWLVAGYVAVWAALGLLAFVALGGLAETPAAPNLLVAESPAADKPDTVSAG
jgi:MFS transporter, MHS family, shikimate and dehydroshikimate transport protein